MQAKDVVTLVISSLALLVSGISAFYTIFLIQRRTMFGELNSILKDISSLMVDSSKLSFDYLSKDQQSRDFFEYGLNRVLKQELGLLVDQATFLANRKLIKSLVTPAEFYVIASINETLEQLEQAENHYLRSINASKDDLSKARATKAYAMFLFRQYNFQKGREQFDKAIDLLKGENDTVHHAKVDIYVEWAWYEREVAKSPSSETLFDKAEKQCSKLGNEYACNWCMKYVEYRKAFRLPVSTQPYGGKPLLPQPSVNVK